MVSGSCWWLVLTIKTEVKKALSTFALYFSFMIRSPVPFSSSSHVPCGIPFAVNVPVEILLVLYVLHQILIQVGFVFSKPTSAHSDSVSLLLPGHLPSFIHFLGITLCIHASFCHLFLISYIWGWTISELGEGDPWKINELSWTLLHSPFPQGSSKQVFEEAKACSSEVQGCAVSAADIRVVEVTHEKHGLLKVKVLLASSTWSSLLGGL